MASKKITKASPAQRKLRYVRTSVQFSHWLKKNPDASAKQKVHAFNRIADSEFNSKVEPTEKKVNKNLVKRI